MQGIRIHNVRHSHVSLLIKISFSALAIAERMSHEAVGITYRYAHLFPTKQDEMAAALDRAGANRMPCENSVSKHFSVEGCKDEFVARWKVLEETVNLVLKPTSGTPLDELFIRYMYYRHAKKGFRDATIKSLRDFCSNNSYEIQREDATLDDLGSLLNFLETG